MFALRRRLCLNVRLYSTAPPHGYLSDSRSAITTELRFLNSVTPEGSQIPTYRVLDGYGKVIEGAEVPEASLQLLLCFDLILSESRQIEESFARKLCVKHFDLFLCL